MSFFNTLSGANMPKKFLGMPETFIKNKTALEQYRMLKKSKGDFTIEVSLQMVNQEHF